MKTQAKLEITTNTSYGWNLDDPQQQGLKMDFSHFNIQFGLANGGLISNKIKTDDPAGFMQFEFGGLQLNWGNTGSLFDKDMNNPGKNTSIGFNGADTGYTYPIYIERFVSGIQWKAWETEFVLQLAAGGDKPENWRPWSNLQRGYITSEFIQRWAYLDTRVQYLRASIPAYLTDPKMSTTGLPDDANYWAHGNPSDPSSLPRDLSLSPQGTLIGFQANQADFSIMLKFQTEKTWAEKNPGSDNGMAFGLDASYTPTDLKGLKTYASVAQLIHYGADESPQPRGYGGKIGWDFALGDPFSLEPYLGVQAIQWNKVGTVASTQYRNAVEGSAGVTLHWPGNGGWQWDPLEQRNGVSFPGLTAAYTIRDKNAQYSSTQVEGDQPIHSLLVTLFEESGDYGLIPGWGASAAVQYFDFLNESQSTSNTINAATANGKLLATAYLDYTLVDVVPGELVPWTRLYYDAFSRPDTGATVQNVKVDAGFKLSKAIRNTVFGLTYESRNLTAAVKDTGVVDLYNGAYGLGLVKAWIEVSL